MDRLDETTRTLVALSAALAAGGAEPLDRSMRRARDQAPAREAEEALLQSYLFLGYPAALNALARWRELTGRAPPSATTDEWNEWRERGTEVCQAVYGDQYERLRTNIRRLHPDMERWMVAGGYGKVLARPGLALGKRELCIAALLAGVEAPRQLYAHLRGALNVGVAPAVVEEALAEASEWTGEDRARGAARVWAEVRSRRSERESGDVR